MNFQDVIFRMFKLFEFAIQRGSKAMDMPVEEYRELSRRCILERNATVHFRNIEALECDVAHCAHAIKCFPKLWTDLPDQCVVIERFKDLKNALQEGKSFFI